MKYEMDLYLYVYMWCPVIEGMCFLS